jgi:hypothetical protein
MACWLAGVATLQAGGRLKAEMSGSCWLCSLCSCVRLAGCAQLATAWPLSVGLAGVATEAIYYWLAAAGSGWCV